MKKVYLLFILFTSILQAQADIKNFKVTSPVNTNFTAYNGQRFDYKFDIRGDYGYKEIRLEVYAESVNSDNLIGLTRWNREGDDYLSFESYTTKPIWVSIALNWHNRSFNTNPGKKFYLKAEYQGISQIFVYTIPEADNDGDGIPNSQDNCPNETGPASNNGCPIRPNLILKKLKIVDTNNNNTIFTFPSNENITPKLQKGKSYDFIIEIENNIVNSQTAQNVSLDILLSTSTQLYPDNNAVVYAVATDANIGNIPARNTIEKTFTVPIGNGIAASPDLTNGKGYYLHFEIDRNNIVPETDEDNIYDLGFIYSTSRTSPILTMYNKDSEIKENIKVFNLSGIKVLEKQVISKEEENALLNQLPKGLYIVKKGQETYKVAN